MFRSLPSQYRSAIPYDFVPVLQFAGQQIRRHLPHQDIESNSQHGKDEQDRNYTNEDVGNDEAVANPPDKSTR